MLYQLSYASPTHAENPADRSGYLKSMLKTRTDTLPLRTFNGTEIKVSTPGGGEQTRIKTLSRTG